MTRRLQDHPWRRRCLGLGIGFLILLAAEGLCRLAGWGRPDPSIDPFVSFEGTSPLFTVDPLTNTHVTASERLKFFVEDRFPRKKAANTYRVFCLGGSTVQGRPYSIETAFGSWLRLGLEAAYPQRRFEVVNCGGVSYASYRLIPILQECLRYEPDLFIICTGQNEFLEERTYATARKWKKAYAAASHFRLYHLLRQLSGPPAAATADESRPILKEEVDALLDYRGGLEAFQRDDVLSQGIRSHFRNNIYRLISLAQAHSVPLLFLRPPVNLKDSPPFKSQAAGPRVEALLSQAQQHFQTDVDQSILLLLEAIKLDPRCARAHYELGQCYLGQADYRRAETCFWRALEEDLCHLRLLPGMAESLFSICRRQEVPCLDLQQLLGRECPQGLVGQEILVDHVHPSIRGHQIIASAIQQHLEPALGNPQSGWEERRRKTFDQHTAGLDDLYYTHGQLRLRNLRLWTQGRTDGPPIGTRGK